MRTKWIAFIIILSLTIVSLVIALCFTISSIDLDTTHSFASSDKINSNGDVLGSLDLNQQQWEQFKNELYESNVQLTQITYIDSGNGNTLVEFNQILVNNDFSFGIVKPSTGKINNSMAQNVEIIMYIVGGALAIASLVIAND